MKPASSAFHILFLLFLGFSSSSSFAGTPAYTGPQKTLQPGASQAPANSGSARAARDSVGVIIPLSGKWESVGQKILKGIEASSGVFTDGPAQSVKYIIRDYGNDEDSIPAIIEELDRNEKVVGIIGPVGERAGELTCREAQARHLPSIIFTQAETPTRAQTYCFRNFPTIDLQAKTLLNAARSMGITRFAVMIPDDRFGKTFTEKFQRLAPSFGISIVNSVTYSPQSVDFKQQLRILFSESKKPAPALTGEKSAVRGTGIEAILIPDTAANAAMIASYMTYNKIKNVRLFGPTLWDTPELVKAGGGSVENAVFLSGFYQGTILSAAQDFNRTFTNTFHHAPTVWEACAYDAAQIVQGFLQNQSPSREALRNLLASLKNYHGVSGTTSFSQDGSLEKTLYILTIKDGQIHEIHP